MIKIIEAVYENGVLKPVDASGLTEQRRYRLTLEELPALGTTPAPEPPLAPDVAAELARRTTLLPDGRLIVRIGGLFEQAFGDIPDDADPIADALQALRRERANALEQDLAGFLGEEPDIDELPH
jgi:hypothetical protein